MYMNRRKKKWLGGILGVIVLIVLAVISFGRPHKSTSITVGSLGTDVQIWKHIASSKQAKQLGLTIKVKSFTDPVALNQATANGQVDVNAFQSWSYLQTYNHQNRHYQLAALGTTYLEPMGIYSKKYHKLSDLPDGATIALANNPANTARGLLLLQSAGLIKLKAGFTATSGVNMIKSNPHHFKFKEIDDTTGPRVLNSTDAVLIGNTIAQTAKLNVLTDSLYHEKINQATKNNINVLATAKRNANNATYKKLVRLYHNRAIQKWITHKYGGTKVEVTKSLAYLKASN